AAQWVKGVVTRHDWIALDQIFTNLEQEAPVERGIRIDLEVEKDLIVDVDEHLLVSAISNLLQNAIKFTRNNETIILRASHVDGAVCIEVEDRCGGLPDGSSEDLFQPFVQKNSDGRGAGLGLAIARQATEAHGGTLHVRNMPGTGCVFVIQIPRTPRVLDQ